MYDPGVLQPGSDTSFIRDYGAARLAARCEARVQEQLPAAPAQHQRQQPERAASQCSDSGGGRFQQADGHALRTLHDMLDAANGK